MKGCAGSTERYHARKRRKEKSREPTITVSVLGQRAYRDRAWLFWPRGMCRGAGDAKFVPEGCQTKSYKLLKKKKKKKKKYAS